MGAGIASQADRAFLRAISVEENLNESRNCEPISCIPSISIIRVEVRKDVQSSMANNAMGNICNESIRILMNLSEC